MRKTLIASLLLLALTAGADDFSYLMTHGSNSFISGNVDISRIEDLVGRWDGAYLWARRNGRQYLIRDAAVLAEARAVFANADSLHDEQARLRTRLRPLERKQDELERQIDRISDRDEDELTAADEKKLADLERQLEAVERQLRVLEDEEERLDDREEELVEIAEKKLRTIVDRAVARGAAERIR